MAQIDNYLDIPGLQASADLSGSQYRAVKMHSVAFQVAAMTNANTERPVGILQNDPDASGKGATVAVIGVCKAEYGGTVTVGDKLGCNNSGSLISDAEVTDGSATDLHHIAVALESGVNTQVCYVYVFPAERIGLE